MSSQPSDSATQIQTIRGFPGTPVFDATNGDIYVSNLETNNTFPFSGISNPNGDSVAVISTASNSEAASVLVGTFPQTPIINSANGDVYVPNAGSGTISVISPATNTVTATIAVGGSPEDGAYDPINGDLYIPNGAGSVSIISTSSLKVVENVTLGSEIFNPDTPVVDPVSGDVYVANEGRPSSLYVISAETNAIQIAITANGEFGTPVFDSANGDFYVYSDYRAFPNGLPAVLVISSESNELVANLSMGADPTTPVFDPSNRDVYVPYYTGDGPNTLYVISSSNQLVGNFSGTYIGLGGLAFDSSNGDIFAAEEIYPTNSTSSEQVVDVISGESNSILQSIPIGCTPDGFGVDPINGAVYLSCQSESYVKVISGSPDSLSATIPIVFAQAAP